MQHIRHSPLAGRRRRAAVAPQEPARLARAHRQPGQVGGEGGRRERHRLRKGSHGEDGRHELSGAQEGGGRRSGDQGRVYGWPDHYGHQGYEERRYVIFASYCIFTRIELKWGCN